MRDDLNLYGYVRNNVIRYVDPLGTSRREPRYGINDDLFWAYAEQRKVDEGIPPDAQIGAKRAREWEKDFRNNDEHLTDTKGRHRRGRGPRLPKGLKGLCVALNVVDVLLSAAEMAECQAKPCACANASSSWLMQMPCAPDGTYPIY
jgi:hypothetical protein